METIFWQDHVLIDVDIPTTFFTAKRYEFTTAEQGAFEFATEAPRSSNSATVAGCSASTAIERAVQRLGPSRVR
jgi:hypothetical protein